MGDTRVCKVCVWFLCEVFRRLVINAGSDLTERDITVAYWVVSCLHIWVINYFHHVSIQRSCESDWGLWGNGTLLDIQDSGRQGQGPVPQPTEKALSQAWKSKGDSPLLGNHNCNSIIPDCWFLNSFKTTESCQAAGQRRSRCGLSYTAEIVLMQMCSVVLWHRLCSFLNCKLY